MSGPWLLVERTQLPLSRMFECSVAFPHLGILVVTMNDGRAKRADFTKRLPELEWGGKAECGFLLQAGSHVC